MTEQGMLEQQRDESREQVKSLQIEKDLRERFVATLSHDPRNPLTAVKSGLEMIARYQCDHRNHNQFALLALQSLRRADQMIVGLLDASRIRAGQPLPIRLVECDLRKLLRECVQELTTVHGNRFELHADQNNAVKYGDMTSPVVIRLTAVHDRIHLTFHNSGNPISVEDQIFLFDAYQRSASARAGAKRGWGLGLTLVRAIVEAHGGKVTVESAPGKGTTFTVDLPRDARERSDWTQNELQKQE